MFTRITNAACSLLIIGTCGCRDVSSGAASKAYAGVYPIKVVATTGMIGDLVRGVGGERVHVTDLFKAGVDPHTYRPTTEDLRLLNDASIVFFNGLHLEGKMGTIFEKLGNRILSIPVAERLDRKRILHEEEGVHDPHVWFDVQLWAEAAGVVSEVLADFDSNHADEYRRRGSEMKSRLLKLHEEVKTSLGAVPKEQRILVTSHDAFRYFGAAYDVEVHGIQGISTESEASVRDITALVDLLVERKARAVFVESSVNPRNMKALIEGCASRGHAVVVGGELFSDAMGEVGTPEGTYEGMIRHNVATLRKGWRRP